MSKVEVNIGVALVVVAAALGGCAPQQQQKRPRVTMVNTAAPGVKYVIVRPAFDGRSLPARVLGNADGTPVFPYSEF